MPGESGSFRRRRLPPMPNPQGVPPAIDDPPAGRSIRRRCASRRSIRRRPSPLDDGRGGESHRRRRRRAACVYVSDDHPGIRRIRDGDGFVYSARRRQAGPQGRRARSASASSRSRRRTRTSGSARIRERPSAGDRTRCARPQAVPLSPRLAARARRRQVRAHARVRRGAAAHPARVDADLAAPVGAHAAPRDGARDARAPPRHDPRAHRQRRIRAQQQLVRPDDAAQSPCGGQRQRAAAALSRQERQ